MINYEKYAELRDSKGLKDSDIAKITNIPQSTLTAWKKGDYMPKADKMEKIAAALDMEYSEFIGPVGKFSALNPNRPELKPSQKDLLNDKLLRLYHNATPDAQKSVMTLLENSQKDASKSLKEA